MKTQYPFDRFKEHDHLNDSFTELPLEDPIAIKMGATVLYIVQFSRAPIALQDTLHHKMDGVIYSPTNFNFEHSQGYKGLRNHEVVLLGRSTPGRFPEIAEDDAISRRHAGIHLHDDTLVISDHSTNGTTIFVYQQDDPR